MSDWLLRGLPVALMVSGLVSAWITSLAAESQRECVAARMPSGASCPA